MAHLQGFMYFWDCYNSLKVVVVVFFFAKICQKVTLFFLMEYSIAIFFLKITLKQQMFFCEGHDVY